MNRIIPLPPMPRTWGRALVALSALGLLLTLDRTTAALESVASPLVLQVALPESILLHPGQSAVIPLTVSSSARVSELGVRLIFPPGRRLEATVQSVPAFICSNALEQMTETDLLLSVRACSNRFLFGTQQLALLRLTAASSQAFGMVTLQIGDVSATTSDGASVVIPRSGKVCRTAILGPEPLLDAALTSRQEATVTLYTDPAGNYRLEESSDLLQWNGFVTGLSTGIHPHADRIISSRPARFFRAFRTTATNLLTGDHLVTTNGEVVFHPVNHASVVLSWNGRMIYVDPVGGAPPYAPFPRADLILVTHVHTDHFNNATLGSVTNSGTVLLAPQLVFAQLPANLRPITIIMTNGATTNVMGLRVDAIPAYNSNHPLGTGNGYVLTIGGRRILFSGDTGDIPDLRALTNIDVAFLCMNVPYTMSVPDAVGVTRAFRPSVIYPYHYRNGDGTFSDLNAFKQQVGTDAGVEVRLRKWY